MVVPWRGAQATDLPFGVVNAPGQRYHPAIVAQAAATLCELFPGRLWVALGTGEASNEHITGERWPPKAKRNARLRECVEVMRALFAGDVVDHEGLMRVDRARLWTLPADPPALIGAAVSEDTARWCGSWADGLVTVNQPRETLERVINAFREGGGEGRPIHLQVHLSWAPARTRRFGSPTTSGAQTCSPRRCAGTSRPSSSSTSPRSTCARRTCAKRCWCPPIPVGTPLGSRELAELGFEEIHLHHVGQDLRPFIEAFGEQVLPSSRHDAQGDQRRLVEERGGLLPRRRDLPGFQRGRLRRPPGLCERVDYLTGLGIDCLWLMPFMPSCQRDDGYDITDFYGVDPRLGTHGDLLDVVRTAREGGMRVIADLVMNHTSDQHPWFRDARRGPESRFHEFYVWRDEKPEEKPGDVVFPDQEDSNWAYDRRPRSGTCTASTPISPT